MKTNPSSARTREEAQLIRTLVVDDSAHVLASLQEYLATLSVFELVGAASDGAEALDVAREVRPELVLMDVRMPVLDGFKACAILRQEFPSIVVILISTDDTKAVQAAASACGAHGFVAKHQIVRELVPEVIRILSDQARGKQGGQQ